MIVSTPGFWMLAAMVIAVRQALDYRGTGRALAVCALGWLMQLIVALFLDRISLHFPP